MGSKLSLFWGAPWLHLAQPASAQTTQQPRSHTHNQRTQPNEANAYGQSSFMDWSNNNHQGQCFITVDGDHDLGYWGDCSTKRARQVK